MDFEDFLNISKTEHDSISVQHAYVDMTGDLIAGIVLSEIVRLHKILHRGDSEWIAIRRYEWWDIARITPPQADRALKILVDKGLINKEVHMFQGNPTTHIRLVEPVFLSLLEKLGV
jgi:hypothetical protein